MTDDHIYHCFTVIRDGWRASGCPEPAVVTYLLPDGSRLGFCWKHRGEVATVAQLAGWEVIGRDLGMVA